MRMSVWMAMTAVLAATLAASACGPGGSSSSSNSTDGSGGIETSPDGGDGTGGSGGVCSSSDFESQVITFCKAQNPPSPNPGELGASCVDGSQCSSQYCLEPFGSAAYCSLLCPNGNECPIGYSCQDTGVDGPACYQDVCIYGGSDAAECTSNLLDELDTACHSECEASRVQAWIECLAAAGRLCGQEDAAEKCGIERGLVESCCIACDTFSW